MKKIIFIFIILSIALSLSFAYSDKSFGFSDYSGMTFDELVELNREIVAEIMSRPEWKEVEVPAGQYTIGVDIPAGIYSMKPKSTWDSVYLRWYPNPDNDYWDYLRTDEIAKFELKEGMRIYIEQTTIFAPARSLGF